MDRADHLAALRRDGETFADACAAAGLDAPVTSCPGWDVADLLWHLAEVHQFWGTVVRDQLSSWEAYAEPERPADDQLLDSYRAGLAQLIDTLTTTDGSTPVWTWSNDHSAAWVVRRMAQETAVHCWDAEQAAGRPQPIEARLASDGIDEFLVHFSAGAPDPVPVGGTVHLHCTDVAGEWLVVPGPGGEGAADFVVTREHAKGDCALRGAASDLLLALWRRHGLDTVDVVGDREVAERFVANPPLE
jgi:uncharacterized protein (TIGR03083 family)